MIVGGVGFLVNFTLLALLYDFLNLHIIAAQIIGAEVAVLTTFVGNNFWTFSGDHTASIWKRLTTFHLSALGGITINSTTVVVLTHYFNMFYGLSLVAGSIAGLVWNYTIYKRFVFKTLPEGSN